MSSENISNVNESDEISSNLQLHGQSGQLFWSKVCSILMGVCGLLHLLSGSMFAIVWFLCSAVWAFRYYKLSNQDIDDLAIKKPKQDKRPFAISVACLLIFFGLISNLVILSSDAHREIGNWFPLYLVITLLIAFACMIGLWKMKKWSAYTYAGLTGFNQILALSIGTWNIVMFTLPAILVCTIFFF